MTYLHVEIKKMQYLDTPHVIQSPSVRKFLGLPPIKENCVLIENLSIPVEKEEVVSLVGPSGVGKSTLLRILADWKLGSREGSILAATLFESPSRRIQVVFQDNCLLPWLDVEGNIAFAIKEEDRATRTQKTADWINKVGLSEKAKAFPKTLSGDKRGRVAFARAFIAPPEVLLSMTVPRIGHYYKEGLQDLLIQFADEPNTDDHSRFP